MHLRLPSLASGHIFFGHEESNEKINEISAQTYGSAGEAGRCCDKVLCIFVMRGRGWAPPGRAVSYRACQDAGPCTGGARLAESDTDACSSSIMVPLGLTFFFPWSLKSWPEPDEGGRRPCQVRQPLNRSLTSNHLPRRSALNTDPWFMQLNPPRPFPASEVARRAAYMAPVTCALGSRIFVGSLEARRTLGGTKISVSLKREFTAFFSSFSLCPPLRGSAI